MSDRFFSSRPIASDRATLDGPEAHHLLHVMRAAAGDVLTLFDGSGEEFVAVIESLGRSTVALRVVERREVDRELPFAISVGVALPKGDRQKWLVEKLTELGARELVPLLTERGVWQPTTSSLDRWRRNVIEAAKQCGRNRLMRIAEPERWSTWISASPFVGEAHTAGRAAVATECLRLIAHPGGKPLRAIDTVAPRAVQLSIGPEGGFTEAEVAAAVDAGWQIVDLGASILRVETAAVALVAALALR